MLIRNQSHTENLQQKGFLNLAHEKKLILLEVQRHISIHTCI